MDEKFDLLNKKMDILLGIIQSTNAHNAETGAEYYEKLCKVDEEIWNIQFKENAKN